MILFHLTYVKYSPATGPKGRVGSVGKLGRTGSPGFPGPVGDAGYPGLPGATGEQGHYSVNVCVLVLTLLEIELAYLILFQIPTHNKMCIIWIIKQYLQIHFLLSLNKQCFM